MQYFKKDLNTACLDERTMHAALGASSKQSGAVVIDRCIRQAGGTTIEE